jgi:uncharacterized protein YdaU (DUF1376 family)
MKDVKKPREKKSKVDIWMPLYVGDYLADTMHLTTEQHGAYLLLIMAYWKNGGPLPNDPIRLSAICRMGLDAWSINEALLKEFFDTETDPTRWIHHRVDKELKKAQEIRHKRSEKARKAAYARWGNKYEESSQN